MVKFDDSASQDYFDQLVQNQKSIKNLRKLFNGGKKSKEILNDLKMCQTVNYELPKRLKNEFI